MGGSHSHEPPSKNSRDLNIVYFGDKYEPEKRIIERPISKLDKRQQWEIVFYDTDKKIFKLRNIENNTFLYLGQEPKEGIPEFSTINLENEMYKYDPAYTAITANEIENKTDFSFISSFGTQMDIVDKNNINMANDNKKENKLQTIKATRVRITTQMNEYLNIFGVFIYGSNKNILNTNPQYAYSSSNYMNRWPASNVIKIVNENRNRKAYDAIQNKRLNGKSIGWNKWHPNNAYAVHTNNDNTGVGGGAWWEYEFNDPVDISLIEIFGRNDCCPNRNKLRVDLYNDNESRTKVIWTTKIDDMLSDDHKVIKITNE